MATLENSDTIAQWMGKTHENHLAEMNRKLWSDRNSCDDEVFAKVLEKHNDRVRVIYINFADTLCQVMRLGGRVQGKPNDGATLIDVYPNVEHGLYYGVLFRDGEFSIHS